LATMLRESCTFWITTMGLSIPYKANNAPED
jgi:hypothetical protein